MVLTTAKSLDIPIATVMSGGYAKDINDTIEIHCNTIRMVRKVFSEDLQPESALKGEHPPN
jgi:hypothetical protein